MKTPPGRRSPRPRTGARRWLLLAAAALAPIFPAPSWGAAAQEVRGRLTEEGGAPVAAAELVLVDTANRVVDRSTSGPDGVFLLRARAGGPHRVLVRRIGLAAPLERRVRVPGRGTVFLSVIAVPAPLILEEITARAPRRPSFLEAQGFYRRREGHPGYFWDRAALDSIRPAGLNALLIRIPGIRFKYDATGRRYPYFRDPLAAYSSACHPLLFVDGTELSGFGYDGNVEAYVHPAEIAGMEVYPGGASVPARFARIGNGCGALIFWTRTGG